MMRWSLVGSTGSLASLYSPRLPSPLVSMIRGVQPCDFCSSPVARNILVLSQPTTPLCGGPAEVHRVLLASCPKYRWWVEKQVLMLVHFLVFGSKTASWRCDSACGATLADGCEEPALQKSGLAAGRKRVVTHSRP